MPIVATEYLSQSRSEALFPFCRYHPHHIDKFRVRPLDLFLCHKKHLSLLLTFENLIANMYAIITPILALATTIASHPLVSGDPVPESPTSETITITDLNIILPETSVDNIETINFVLNGDQATGLVCKQDAPSLPSTPIVCGNSGYSFILEKGEEGTYALKVSHGIRDGYVLRHE